MTVRVVRIASAAAAGVLVLLGAAGPVPSATGSPPPASRAHLARAVPTRVPQPGDVLPTAGRTLSISPSRILFPRGGGVSVPVPVRSSVGPVPTAAASPVSPSAGAAGTPWWQWGAIALAGLLVGAAGCFMLLRPRRRKPDPAPRPASAERGGARASSPGATPGLAGGPDDNLAKLISSVIAARDLLDPTSVLSQRLGAALSGGGVHELMPLGQAFDPSRHRAVETAPTTDPAVADRIAEVQRVGYRDARHTIRPPDVVVYRLEASR